MYEEIAKLDGGIAQAKDKWEEVSRHRFINKQKAASSEAAESAGE